MTTQSMDISVQEASEILTHHADAKLIDVREDFEREICVIQGSIQLTEKLAQEMQDTWDKNTLLLFHCHHGGRSLQAAYYFQELGFNKVHNIVGGIDAWSQEIDPTISRY